MRRVKRVCVVGNSGSGKSYLAQRLADRLGVPHLELDALHHRPGWQEAPVEEFRSALITAMREAEARCGGWVADGNYRGRAADLLRPDVFVWLDYSRPVVFARVLRRTLARVAFRRQLWSGNRERWRTLVKRDPLQNILLWSWSMHDPYRERWEAEARADTEASWVRLRTPRETRRWLAAQDV